MKNKIGKWLNKHRSRLFIITFFNVVILMLINFTLEIPLPYWLLAINGVLGLLAIFNDSYHYIKNRTKDKSNE